MQLTQNQSFLAASFFLMNLFTFTLGQAKECYLTGNAPLPKDVNTPKVQCVKPDTFPGVPDVTDGKVKFSQIDYRKFKGSPVGFALSRFALEKNNLANLKVFSSLYDATGAGLRSRNDKNNVKMIKGVQFFLAMQINRLESKFDFARRNLGKTKKNCTKCSKQDKDALEAIGKTFK